MATLLDVALPAELEDLRRLHKALTEAKEQTGEHKADRERLEDDRYRVAAGVKQDAVERFNAYRRGDAKPIVSTGFSRAELDTMLAGAAEVIRNDGENEARAYGALQARTLEVNKACEERWGVHYRELAAQLREAHAVIGGAQRFAATLTGDTHAGSVDPETWEMLFVPGSRSMQAFKGHGGDLGDQFRTQVLAGGSRQACHEAACHAVDASEAQLREVFGGAWPLKRSAAGGARSYATTAHFDSPASPSTRRAVLERAAEKMT